MQFYRFKEFYFVVLVTTVFSCGTPMPTDRTYVYVLRDVGYQKFKPVLKEKYNGDTILINNYLVANTWTSPSFGGNILREVQEDSVLTKIINGIGRLDLMINQSNNSYNVLNSDIVLHEKPSWNKRIENNVFEYVSGLNKMEGKLNLIPVILYRKVHSAGGFNGPGEVNINYFVIFLIYIFNEKKELIYSYQTGVRAKPESIWHWEEALAFPIEASVTDEHFEEMIMKALRNYVD